MPDPVNVSRPEVDDWEHGLITGNGRQGAVCHGGPAALRVTLSHERLFLPMDEPLDPPDTASALPRLRELLYGQAFQAAADEVMALAIAEDPRYRQLRQSDPFVGAATLTFIPDQSDDANAAETATGAADQEWGRSVDFGTGVVSHRWGQHSQEVFVSRAHDVVVIRIADGRPISGRLHLGPIRGTSPAAIRFDSGAKATGDTARLSLRASFTQRFKASLEGYTVGCDVSLTGGSVEVDLGGASITISGADEILLLARTVIEPGATSSIPAGFGELLAAHVPLHRGLFDRCRLELPDDRLVRTLFDAGRYAIISASGELPPNLQGVWSGTFDPAWRGGYTLDGNLASALAAVAPTGTPELLLPLFDLLDAHLADFRRNAERLYGLPGIVVPPHLTTHGRHNHFTPRWCLTFWTAGAGWLARLYYDYWRYTGDREFLRERALPFMREAVRFYEAFIVDRDGAAHFAPSYSPENAPDDPREDLPDHGSQACVNATMDAAVVRDLLTNLIEGTTAAGLTQPRLAGWTDLRARLPAYLVDDDGCLAEWLWPGPRNHHAHRHASHLFGLWYEPDPVLLDDPDLRRAAVRSVRRRLAWWRDNGDEMAFGLVQLGLAAASLGLAPEAYETVYRLADRYWRANLVPTHNAGSIFNTDICGGLPALVTAMLVSSRGNVVRLLPALPPAWPTGSIHGVLLRGGIRLEHLTWSPDLVRADLVCVDDRDLTVSVGDEARRRVRARAARSIRVSFP